MQNIPVFTKDTPAGANPADGYVIVLDKPLGWTSTDAVRKIRFAMQKCGYRKLKVGHAGTLDPLATGLLVVCLGKATKMVDALQAQRKEYVAGIRFGATTPSYDLEHEIDAEYPWEHIAAADIDRALGEMTGEQLQTPPVYSAKKIDGLRAYEYAREGTEVELRKALVTIYDAVLEDYAPPVARVRITCSKGTYIRSIARDLGQKLGSGAYLVSLRRTRSGDFTTDEAFGMDEIIGELNRVFRPAKPDANNPAPEK